MREISGLASLKGLNSMQLVISN